MPDQLTPLARISAAIEKLERLKAESTPGPWAALAYLFASVHGDEAVRIDTPEVESDRNVAESVTPADADLIVTVHRTIDPVLAILRDMFERYGRTPDWSPLGPSAVNALALADSIIGGES